MKWQKQHRIIYIIIYHVAIRKLLLYPVLIVMVVHENLQIVSLEPIVRTYEISFMKLKNTRLI